MNMAGFTADRVRPSLIPPRFPPLLADTRSAPQMLHTTPDDMFELMLKVHNTAPFRLIKEVAPYMRSKDPKDKGKNRSIINVSSTSGCVGLHRETSRLDCACAGADQLIALRRDCSRTACTETSDRSVPPCLHSAISLFLTDFDQRVFAGQLRDRQGGHHRSHQDVRLTSISAAKPTKLTQAWFAPACSVAKEWGECSRVG